MNTNTDTTTAEKRSATIEKNRAARITERGYTLPLVLTCKVTGKQVKYTSPSYIDKVIAKVFSHPEFKTWCDKIQSSYDDAEAPTIEACVRSYLESEGYEITE